MAMDNSMMYSSQYRQADGPPPYHPSAIKQWASRVVSFSSQYNNSGWSANQTLGEPRVYPNHGDLDGAWASGVIDKNQFIDLEFEIAVVPMSINIYETFNPGAVTAVKARDPTTGKWEVLWSTRQPTTMTTSRIFSPPLKETSMKTNVIKLHVDCSAAGTWCEIDAVQLVGIREGAVPSVDDTEFISSMGSLVNSKLHSDVKFEINGKKVYGHKAILAARSPFFARMFEKSKNDVFDMKLPSMTEKDLECVLAYIYTNRLPSDASSQSLLALCKGASNFQMPGLKTAATYKLITALSCNNVVDIFLSAENDSDLDGVKSVCLDFMSTHLKAMSQVSNFEKLPQRILVTIVQQATAKLCLES